MNTKISPLESSDTITIARELSNRQIQIIKTHPELGGNEIAQRLETLRDAVWGNQDKGPILDKEAQNKIFDKTIADISPIQKKQLLSSYARMGHLYEIAALTARSNYIKSLHRKNKTVPGGIDNLILENGNKDVAELVEKLNQPVFEVVVTAHPTNVNSIESMSAQRDIDKALEAKDDAALTQALIKYQSTPLLHQAAGEDGVIRDANLTVRDETRTALYFLGNLYEDLPKVYSNYDTALSKYAQKKDSVYDPLTLQLNTRFGSWGSSGDKDGNTNVTAESTLEAIALHTQAILTRYKDDLANLPALKQWQNKFETALDDLNPLVEEIGQLRTDALKSGASLDSAPEKLNERFDQLSGKLSAIRNQLDGKNFEKDLKKSAATDPEALKMLRRFRTFGFNFSKIEYRETAKEYGRVVNELVSGYEKLSPHDKVAKLTELLQKPGNEAADLFHASEQQIISGAGKKYDGANALPISYHTLKRMSLARDFSDIIKDNVLAECGQIDKNQPTESEIVAQGLANILEAQFLQRAVEKDGKRPLMGIVPLFEEPGTMEHIDEIMNAAYENPAYKQHLAQVKENNGVERLSQQVMIAHSDNARRSGLQAARAYIHVAHHKMRELNKKRAADGKDDVQIQFFEGGSISDAYRNGVRAISASVNAFGLQDFAKFTFQGGDLLNYFNHPDSTLRLFDRQISHQAKSLKNDGGKWVTRRTEPDPDRIPVPAVEQLVTRALKSTLHDYQAHDFTENTMGVLMAALGYNKTVQDSNAGSRAGARPVFAAGSSTSIGAATIAGGTPEKTEFKIVPIDKVRTIGFSKTWQGSGIIPSWIGALNLNKYLENANSHSEKNLVDPDLIPRGKLGPAQLRIIYKKSPTFSDSIDRAAFGIALTDMDTAKAIANSGLKNSGEYQKQGIDYLDRVEETYRSAAELAYSAITGSQLNGSNLSNAAISAKMTEALPQLKDDIINKTNYRAAILHWQLNHPELTVDPHMGRVAQCAKDTVEHGRWLGASDPTYARQRLNDVGRSI